MAPKAVVNAFAKVGVGVILNTGALIEHECVIGDYSHIAPGTVLAGNVSVGSNTFIGANSTVKQGIVIGNNAVIGAGSVVLTDIGDNEMWAGVPAKKIKDIE
jgi:acetyltransferase-like isoleucine patch superfamily enzyme